MMKKTADFVLKIVAAVMAVAALVCVIIAFWDQIVELIDTIIDKVEEKRADRCFVEPEYYSDFDDSGL